MSALYAVTDGVKCTLSMLSIERNSRSASCARPCVAKLFAQLSTKTKVFVAAWAVCEVLNFYTHLHLASLRSDGSREAKIPTAWPFRRVCSPNYSFEIGSWIFYSLATRSPAAWAFTALGAWQMATWSGQELQRYKRKRLEAYHERLDILKEVTNTPDSELGRLQMKFSYPNKTICNFTVPLIETRKVLK